MSTAAGLSPADAKLLLKSKLPRLVGWESTAAAAASRARALEDVGFDAFVVSRSALGKPPPPRAKTFRVEGGSLHLDVLRFAPGELKLIVEGEFQRATEEREIKRVHVEDQRWERREDVLVSRRSEGETFLHLFGDSHAKAVEILPQHFNFRGLGADFGTSVGLNTKRFIARVREMFPGAQVDDRLRRYPPFPDEGAFSYDATAGPHHERKLRKDDNAKAALAASRLIAIHALRR